MLIAPASTKGRKNTENLAGNWGPNTRSVIDQRRKGPFEGEDSGRRKRTNASSTAAAVVKEEPGVGVQESPVPENKENIVYHESFKPDDNGDAENQQSMDYLPYIEGSQILIDRPQEDMEI